MQGRLSERRLSGAGGGTTVQLPRREMEGSRLSPEKNHVLTAMCENSACEPWLIWKPGEGRKQLAKSRQWHKAT